MSVLAFPRIYLGGRVSWDPSVANNDPGTYERDTGHAVLRRGEDAAAARSRMIETAELRGDWNYFGTHRCAFEGTQVVGGTLEPGPVDVAEDPLVGAPVQLVGTLVDIDPYGIVSQVFFDELVIGRPGHPHLRARPRRRMVARWITFSRNRSGRLVIAGGAAAAWQAVLPREELEHTREDRSPLLRGLLDAMDAQGAPGLALRLCTYSTRYFTRDVGPSGVPDNPSVSAGIAALTRSYARGEVRSNPAYSAVVGTLGLWLPGDSETAIGGRHLHPTPLIPPQQPPSRLAAPASAELHPGRRLLSLDLSSTVPEITTDLVKAPLNPAGPTPVAITVSVTRDGTTTPIGVIRPEHYAQAAYEARGGIVDLPVDGPDGIEDLIRDGRLELRAGDTGPVAARELLAQEQELVASCDDAAVYLEAGEEREVTIRVRERGAVPAARPPAEGLVVHVARHPGAGVPGVAVAGLEVAADGTAVLQLPTEGDFAHLSLVVAEQGAPHVPPRRVVLETAQFLSVRTLPADSELAAIPDAELSWERVFAEVLAHYHVVTPRMSTIIDLSDPDAVRTFAGRILQVTDPGLFESTRYMPVTRDMSAHRRHLLRRYCALLRGEQLAEPPPPTPPGRSARAAAGRPAVIDQELFPKSARG